MEITNKNIDNGIPFDWGKTSSDYAKFRDIYPKEFYQKIVDRKMKACRGIGASLSEKEISKWEQEHKALLERIAPDEFYILHYCAVAEPRKR